MSEVMGSDNDEGRQMLLYHERFPTLAETLGKVHGYSVFVNGRFVSGDDATLSPWDHGLLYGDAVFEGIRAYAGVAFRLEDHLDRLARSAAALQMSIPLDKAELTEVVTATLKINALEDAHIKVLVTRGIGAMGMDPRVPATSSVIVYAYPYPPILGTEAVQLVTSAVRRKSPHAVDAKIKSTNYLDNILAKLQAIASGSHDALMLDTNSFVAEATSANLFIAFDGALFTPFCHAALEGITRNVVIACAEELGIRVAERNLTLYDVYTADEVFLTGTAAEIVAVRSVDGRDIGGEAPGTLTQRLTAAYHDVVRAERAHD